MNKKLTILLGALILFNVDPSYDIESRDKIEASLRFTGKHAYYYVEDSVYKADFQDNIQALAKEFDKTIYPTMTQKYGSEWNPGIDNDSKITVLITPMLDSAGGYFNPSDGFLKKEIPSSNQREMTYLNSGNLEDTLVKSYLAHEFQHLINFYQKKKLKWIDEDVWLNEALSEYASTACEYDEDYENSNLEKRVKNFLRDPSNSLTEWLSNTYDYSPINLFMQYLIGQRGEEEIKNILDSNNIGTESIQDFEQVFRDWTITSYLNNCNIQDSKYCYKNENLDFYISPTASYTLMPITSLSISSVTKEWSPRWYKISGISREGKTLQISFVSQNPEANFILPYLTVDKNGEFAVKDMQNSKYIPQFGKDINSVILIPSSDKQASFSLTASVVELPAPEIENIFPAQETFGAEIIIKGKNFLEDAKIRFGNLEAQEVQVLDSETISVIAPEFEEQVGKINISVINPDNQAVVLVDGFEYKQKQLTQEELIAKIKSQIQEIQMQILELTRQMLIAQIAEIKAKIE